MKKLRLILFSLILSNFIFNNTLLFAEKKFISYDPKTLIITDGDTLRQIGESKIRLEGIDAPEIKQVCYNKLKNPYPCGELSRSKLASIINMKQKKKIYCYYSEKDRYNRYLAECFVGRDSAYNINKIMVRTGHAVAYLRYSKKYLSDQEYAKKEKLGIWQGTFVLPEEWRRKNK